MDENESEEVFDLRKFEVNRGALACRVCHEKKSP